MKKLFAFALCAAILGICATPAWALGATATNGAKTMKSDSSVAGKTAKKNKKGHKKKKGKKGKTAGKGHRAKKV